MIPYLTISQLAISRALENAVVVERKRPDDAANVTTNSSATPIVKREPW